MGPDPVLKMAVGAEGGSDHRDFLFRVPSLGSGASTLSSAANLPSAAEKEGSHTVGAASLLGSDGRT